MRISEVTAQFALDYCGVSDEQETERISACMSAAKAFITGYTGLDESGMNKHEDITAAYLVLINEMYTNRDYSVSTASRNPLVRQILSLHSVNYL